MSLASKAVIGIVLSKDKKQILIIKRRDIPIWVLPGGGVDTNEACEDAVIREIFEETGLHTILKRKVAVYSPVLPFATHTEFFECTPLEGELSLSDETRDVGFFPVDALPYPFFPVHEYLIADALSGGQEVIKKPVPGVGWGYFTKYLVTHPVLIGRYVLARLGLPLNS